jgi:O-antigen/teichoic acid export membrane protein
LGVFNDFSWVVGARIVVMILALGSQTVLARTLGPEGRGAYEACLLFGATLILVFNLGVETSSIYFISSERMSLAVGTANGLALCTTVGVCAFACGLALIRSEPSFLSGLLAKARPMELMLGLAGGFTTLVVQTLLGIMSARKLFRAYSTVQVFQRIVTLVLVIVFVGLAGWYAGGALLAIVLADLTLVTALLAWLRRRGELPWIAPRLAELRKFVSYGMRFYVGKISNQVNYSVGPLVLAALATRTELGYYGQASAIAVQFMTVPDAFYTVFVPRVAGSAGGEAQMVARAGRLMGYVGVACYVTCLVAAAPAFALLFSRAFLPAVAIFKVLFLAFVLRAYGKIFEPYLVGTDRPGAISLAVTVGLAVNLALLAVLYSRFGLIGAAWSLVGNYVVSTTLILALFLRSSGLRARECLLPRREDVALVRDLIRRLSPRW